MVWEQVGEEEDGGVGLTCCNHQTEQSSNRLLFRWLTRRIYPLCDTANGNSFS